MKFFRLAWQGLTPGKPTGPPTICSKRSSKTRFGKFAGYALWVKSNPDTKIIAENLSTALGMEQLPAISAGAPRSHPTP